MSSFPLIHTRLSNEKIMKGVFINTLFFLLPFWVEKPAYILSFLVVLVIGLLIDSIWNLIRYGKPVCGVSAAVTAGVLECLTPGIPLWSKIIGITIALVLGKHIWGGTGKNPVNPAVFAFFFLSFLFYIPLQIFPVNFFIIPALLLSLMHLSLRPYPGLGLAIGMSVALFFQGNFSLQNIISNGIIFWSCLVVTDPVTSTSKPLVGFTISLVAGFIGLMYMPLKGNPNLMLALSILSFNLISFVIGKKLSAHKFYTADSFKLKKLTAIENPFLKEKTSISENYCISEQLFSSEIIQKIREFGVFGLGGAGFPADRKIDTVLNTENKQKYFIINGVECDPGLIHDHWLLRKYPAEIFAGIEIVKRCINFEKVILAVKDKSGLVFPKSLEIREVADRYPIGAERILIKALLHKEIPIERNPAQFGILVLNAQTVLWIFKAIFSPDSKPGRFITVADLKSKRAKVVQIESGQKIMDISKSAFPETRGLVYTGGGMMQGRRAEENETVSPDTNFIAIADKPIYKESPQCSCCNRCKNVCPVHLEVNRIAELVSEKKYDALIKYHPEYCLGCGSCTYVCLAGRNLCEKVKLAKEKARDLSYSK